MIYISLQVEQNNLCDKHVSVFISVMPVSERVHVLIRAEQFNCPANRGQDGERVNGMGARRGGV